MELGEKMSTLRRMLVAGGALAGFLIVGTAIASSPNLPSLFASQIRAIHGDSRAPAVLLPASMPLDGKKFFPSGGPKGAGYDLSIGLAKNCGDATVCFSADFLAIKGGKVYGTPVTIKGASKAGYRGISCGASCSPAQVDFVVGGFLYTIQANMTGKNGKGTLIAAAQSAIAAGAR
jgi:hypothetical protein